MLEDKTGQKLNQIASPGDNLRVVMHAVVTKAYAKGWVSALFKGALEDSPGNQKLKALGAKKSKA